MAWVRSSNVTEPRVEVGWGRGVVAYFLCGKKHDRQTWMGPIRCSLLILEREDWFKNKILAL
jgi:hypothetical protein